MSDAKTGQVSSSAAEIYDSFFVPALFAAPAAKAVRAVGLARGHDVLDVACGTGVLARYAAETVGSNVTGVDINPGMLGVARKQNPNVIWQEGRAEALPFEDDAFDAVFCQFGLMFFEDREAALREMWRVLKPGGALAVAVWAAIEASPGYTAMATLLRDLFGADAEAAMRAPFMLGDTDELAALFTRAGIGDMRVLPLEVMARFPSLEAWVETEIRGWTLADQLDDAQFARLLDAAKTQLRTFELHDGAVAFASPAHLAIAVKGR
jgi:SAM-dependent methyltransferase